MSREEEYKQKCRQVKDYYLEEICEHEDADASGMRRTPASGVGRSLRSLTASTARASR